MVGKMSLLGFIGSTGGPSNMLQQLAPIAAMPNGVDYSLEDVIYTPIASLTLEPSTDIQQSGPGE
jgi:hypothetical protein